MSQRAELVRLLHEVDGQLGLVVYRGEHGSRWNRESQRLISRIRAMIVQLEQNDGPVAP